MKHALRVLVAGAIAVVALSVVGVAPEAWAVSGRTVVTGDSSPSAWPVAPLARNATAMGTDDVSVAVRDGALELDWSRVKGAARYRVSWRGRIFKDGEPTGTWSEKWLGRRTLGASELSFQVTGLVNGRKYQVRLESRGKARRSRWVVFSTTAARPSAPVPTSTTSVPAPSAPSTPTTTAPPVVTCGSGGEPCVVGSTGPGGGTVFYAPANTFTVAGAACGSECRYLEAAPADWSAGSSSDPLLVLTTVNGGCAVTMDASARANALLIGSGFANTAAIMAACSGASSPAASAASLYAPTVNGRTVSDWFLPSLDELSQLAQSDVGGLQTSSSDPNSWEETSYWSSSQTSGFYAGYIWWEGTRWSRADINGSVYPLRVRPVRAFS